MICHQRRLLHRATHASFGLLILGVVLTGAPAAADDLKHTRDSLSLVKERIDDGQALLVDVREQREWDAGHVAGAVLVALSDLSKRAAEAEYQQELQGRFVIEKEGEADEDSKPILYVHCRSGRRCLVASEILKHLGYDARALEPGFADLIDAGFPLATPE